MCLYVTQVSPVIGPLSIYFYSEISSFVFTTLCYHIVLTCSWRFLITDFKCAIVFQDTFLWPPWNFIIDKWIWHSKDIYM